MYTTGEQLHGAGTASAPKELDPRLFGRLLRPGARLELHGAPLAGLEVQRKGAVAAQPRAVGVLVPAQPAHERVGEAGGRGGGGGGGGGRGATASVHPPPHAKPGGAREMCSGPGGCNHGATRAGQSRGREGPAGGNPPAPPPPPPNFPPPFPSGAGRAGVAPPDLHRGGLVLRPPGHPRAGVSSAGAVWPRPALRMRARPRGGASGCCGGRGGAGGRRARARARARGRGRGRGGRGRPPPRGGRGR